MSFFVVDDFLSDFDSFRLYADAATFQDETNPADGVVYPHICKEIPEAIASEISQKLSELKGGEVAISALFMRMSPDGVAVPHQCHTDNSMGQWSFMLYMNRPEDCQGGTGLVYHRQTGIAFAPQDEECLDLLIDEQNDGDKWETHRLIEMQPNRAAIFRADAFHRAEPVGGFGSTSKNARLVLTGFFS